MGKPKNEKTKKMKLKIMRAKITISLLTAILMIACNTEKKISIEDTKFSKYFFNENNLPIVKGKLLNLTKDEINNTKIGYGLITPFAQRFEQKTSKLNSDGTFELEIDYSFPNQQIWLTVGKFLYAGIYANKELYIEINADSLRESRAYMNAPGVNYLGADGELNTIMNNRVLYKSKKWRKANKAVTALVFDRNSDIDNMLIKYDSLYTILNQLDDDYIAENPSPYSYLIKNERMSNYYGGLLIADKAGKIKPELFDKIKQHKAYLVSNNSSRFYKALYMQISSKLDNSRYIGGGVRVNETTNIEHEKLKDYSKLTTGESELIEEIIYQKQLIKDSLPYDTLRYGELLNITYEILKDTVFASQTLKVVHYLDSTMSKEKADMLKLQFSSKESKNKKIILETVLPHTNTEWTKTILKKETKRNADKLARIKKLIKEEKQFTSDEKIGEAIVELTNGAKLYKIENMEAEKLLTNIKSTFKGKALILDFWATWCGPCLVDLPYSKKLHDQMEQEPIEFVYLCTSSGSSFEKWKKTIAELELGGTHLFVESSIESELMNLFSFSGFPSYAFIDIDGNYKAGTIQRMSFLDKEKVMKLIKGE